MANNVNNVEGSKWFAVREEDLQELESLLGEMQGRAGKASDDGRIYLMQNYIRIVSLLQPEIHRVRARFSRETLAALRKEHKEHKLNARTSER